MEEQIYDKDNNKDIFNNQDENIYFIPQNEREEKDKTRHLEQLLTRLHFNIYQKEM